MQARGNVEAWLSQVEQSMAVCLRKLARAGHQTYPNQPRTQWVTQQPSQLVLLISQVSACHLLVVHHVQLLVAAQVVLLVHNKQQLQTWQTSTATNMANVFARAWHCLMSAPF